MMRVIEPTYLIFFLSQNLLDKNYYHLVLAIKCIKYFVTWSPNLTKSHDLCLFPLPLIAVVVTLKRHNIKAKKPKGKEPE